MIETRSSATRARVRARARAAGGGFGTPAPGAPRGARHGCLSLCTLLRLVQGLGSLLFRGVQSLNVRRLGLLRLDFPSLGQMVP